MNKILKLSFDGKDLGYLGMQTHEGKNKFYGGVDRSEAVEFYQVEYPKFKSAYYYEVVKNKGHYLDIQASNSQLFSDKPSRSSPLSSIVAWTVVEGELSAVIAGGSTTEAIGISATDPHSLILYGNLEVGDEQACKVEVLDAQHHLNVVTEKVLEEA
jgi:hypothetical protein